MKVSAFYPIFIAKDLEAEVEVYKNIGFTQKHHFQTKHVDSYTLETRVGSRIDIMKVNIEDAPKPGFYGMRVNVDDFDEGMEYFLSQGYQKSSDIRISKTSKFIYLKAPSGINVMLIKHIREPEESYVVNE